MKIVCGYLAGLLSALAGYYLHIWPRFYNRYFGIDTWRHLLAAEYIRKNKSYPKLMPEHYLINEPSDYPPVLRFILALFPRAFIDRKQFAFCPAIECAQSFFIFIFIYRISGNLTLSLVTQILYYAAPIVIIKNSSLTTRTLASFLFMLSFLSLISYVMHPSKAVLIASIILISLLLLVHRMSIQALSFLVIVFSIWERNMAYLAVFLAGIAGAVILSGGFYIQILRGHLAMLRFWKANIHYRYAHMVRGFKAVSKEKDPVFKIYQKIQNLPFTAVLAANAFIVLPLWAVFLGPMVFKEYNLFMFNENFYQKMLLWSISLSLFAVVVRQFKGLGFIGEGERYLEYNGFPTAMISAALFLNAGRSFGIITWWIFAGLLVLGSLLPAFFLQYKVVFKDESRSIKEPLWKIFDYINQLEAEVRLITIPLYLSDAVVYFSKAKAFTTDNSIAHITHYSGFWPILTRPLTDIMKENQIDFLFVNEEYVTLQELNFSEKSVLKREGSFCLCRLGGNA